MSHTSALLNGLNYLRERDYLLDVTIWAGGVSFKVRNSFFCRFLRFKSYKLDFFFVVGIVKQSRFLFLCGKYVRIKITIRIDIDK